MSTSQEESLQKMANNEVLNSSIVSPIQTVQTVQNLLHFWTHLQSFLTVVHMMILFPLFPMQKHQQ